ncbi:MAG TPA: metallophosphoesterase [Bacillota bacterium]|nr:metallophosphoesterase [Bacillota bacterium]
MVRIGVVGDIHGNYSGLRKVVEEAGMVAQWLFTGDGYREITRLEAEFGVSIAGVAGNCDFFTEFPGEQRLQLGNYRILLTHGHIYGVKQGLTRLALAGQSQGAALVVFGHTHLPFDDCWNNVRLFNPGSLSVERSAGRPSYGLIELSETGIKCQLCRI